MPVSVSLKEIADAMSMDFGEFTHYVNKETGAVFAVSRDMMSHLEEGGTADDLPESERGEFEDARLVRETDRCLPLPTQWDVNEWERMQEFIAQVGNPKVQRQLADVSHGKGAFRRFKDTLARHGMLDAWYGFLDDARREVAIEWCEENGLAYREE
jgi:uncharacterized protein UPF0158